MASGGSGEDVLVKALKDLNLVGSREFILKPEQEAAVRALLKGQDVLAVLPTGYGKSLIYQMFVRAKDYELNGQAAILVISPLVSIIKDQLQEMNSLGYCAVDCSELSAAEIRQCNFKVIYATAEKVKEKAFREILMDSTSPFHQKVSAVVVDESHTVETWTGKRKTNSKTKGVPFREAYGELAVLRSLCKEGIPILALTGTADDTTQSTICSQLSLKANTLKLFISPNRPNIRISVTKVKKEDMESQLDWLIELTKQKGKETPKTIIFCNTLRDIACVVNLLLLKLGEDAYVPVGSRNPEDFLIGIFHSVSWPKKKQKLLTDFRAQTQKRIIVASTALSMGVNFGDVRYVINWGPARDLLDQLQEAGRAGRDGIKSHVIIVYRGQQLSQCEQRIKDFVKCEGCYRVAMYKPFDINIKPMSPGHDCCSHCALECCGKQCAEEPTFEKREPLFQSPPALTRPVCNEDRSDLREALIELVKGRSGNAFGAVSSHVFSDELIEDIVSNCHRLFTLKDVSECLPVYTVVHCLKFLELIQETFGDIPNFDSMSQFFAMEGVALDHVPGEPMEYFDGYFDLPDDDNDELDFIED